MLKCAHCDKEYKYESERKRHQKSHFPQFECKICAKKFSFLSALRRHQKQHERTGNVQCLECSGTFRDDSLLKRHVQYAHRGTFCCAECANTFSSELALRTHLKTHKPRSERRFRCNHKNCNKTFNFPHHLKHHELTHTNAKQHYCAVCGKGFIQSHHLKTHIKMHSPENWLYCMASDCSKKFFTKHAWTKHLATHQNDLKSNPETRFDSGISSDSSSISEIQENIGGMDTDNFLCALCGKLILRSEISSHKRNCVKSEVSSKFSSFISIGVGCELPTGLDCGQAQQHPNGIPILNINHISNKGSDCNIISGLKNEMNTFDTNNNNHPGNGCEGCVCGGVRRPRDSDNLLNTKQQKLKKDDMPEIEYRIDGVIKIRETFDLDIVVVAEPRKDLTSMVRNEESKYVPFNSCKAVLGNCIVSDDGSIGEECLCARMVVDEQQMSAQEIDELTPNPNAVWVS